MKTLALLALTSGYCGSKTVCPAPAPHGAPQTVQIKRAVMARGYNGKAVGITTTFKPTDTKLHCVVDLNRVATVTARGVWIAVDAAGMHNFKIVEAKLPRQLVDQLHFHASLPRPWPVGKYRIDIYINGKLARSLPYKVAK